MIMGGRGRGVVGDDVETIVVAVVVVEDCNGGGGGGDDDDDKIYFGGDGDGSSPRHKFQEVTPKRALMLPSCPYQLSK